MIDPAPPAPPPDGASEPAAVEPPAAAPLPGDRAATRWRLAGLALVAGSALTLQVSLTRVFSLLVWYHFAFLAVALALLGFTAGGLLVQARGYGARASQRSDLALGVGGSIGAVLLLASRMPFGSSVVDDAGQVMLFAGLIAALLVPFTLAGVVVAATLGSLRAQIGRAYLADLAGSGVGCGLSVVAMDSLGGGPGGMLVASLAAVLGAACLAHEAPDRERGRRQRRAAGLFVVLALATGLARFPLHGPFYLPNAKLYPRIPKEFILQRDCTSVACVDFFTNPLHFGLWGLASTYQGPKPEQIGVVIDAWAVTSIVKGDTGPGGAFEARHPIFEALPPSLVYQHLRGVGRTPGETLVIGAGGGIDVRTALHFGASHVDAVEINPSLITATRSTYDRFAGGLYRQPNVRLVHAEGRHFMRRQRKKYDVIQVSGVDTFAASQAGAFALSENYLYTTEALREFIDHLEDDGTLSFTRWLYKPPRQTLRLCAIIDEAMRELGLGDAASHIVVVSAPVPDSDLDFSVVMIKRRGFTAAEVDAIRKAAVGNGFSIVYAPHGAVPDTAFARYFAAPDRRSFIASYPFDIEPSTDDRPFFFEHARLSRLLVTRDPIFGASSGQLVLVVTLGLVLAAAALFIGVPARLARRAARASGEGAGAAMAARWQAHFLLLGLAYLTVELVFVPRFTLFLGNPSYALSVVLLSLLISSGLGAALSPRVLGRGPRAVGLAMAALVAVLVAYEPLLPRVFDAALAWSFPARAALSVALVAVPAVLMGIPFPAAVARHGEGEGGAGAWVARAWALNGYTSVVASVGVTLVAMSTGFRVVLLLAACAYLGVAAIWWREEQRAT